MKFKINYWILTGIILVILLFSFLELLHPYNFTKDDNLSGFLPVILEGMQQLFSGNFPWINFHQYTGFKLFETGTYAIVYPVTILSYFIAHYILGNDFATIEIFVFIHLILGYIASFLFLKLKTKNNLLSFLGSIAIVFSGYNIIMSGNWYYAIPTVLFMPLILFLDEKLITKNNLKIMSILGIFRGIYFYSGNAQYFAFSLIFEFLYLLMRNYQNNWENSLKLFKNYIISLVISLIVIFPLLIPQLSVVRESNRGHNSFIGYVLSHPSSIQDIIKGSLFVYPLVGSKVRPAYAPESFIDIYYSGTLFSLLFILGGIYYMRRYKLKSFKKIDPLFWLAILAIILSLGYIGGLYLLGAFLPVIKNFSGPYKITIFSSFFIISAGSLFLSKFSDKYRLQLVNMKRILILISIFFFILLAYHLTVATTIAGTYYGDHLPLNISHFNNPEFQNERFISIFTNSSINPQLVKYSTNNKNFPESGLLSQNFATYFGLDHISGYEPFVDDLTTKKVPVERTGLINKKLNLTTLEEYSIRYILITKDSLRYHSDLQNLAIIFEDKDIFILDIGRSKGYIFSQNGKINFSQRGSNFLFTTNFSQPTNVTLNFFYKTGYLVKIDNQFAELKQDSFGRMYFLVPEGNHNIKFYYRSVSLIIGILLSVLFSIFLIIYLIFLDDKISVTFFRLLSKLKFNNRKIKVLIILLIVLLLLIMPVLFLNQLITPQNIQDILKERTNINLTIGGVKNSLFLTDLTLFNISLQSPKGDSQFFSQKLHIKIDFWNSLKKSMAVRRPALMLSEGYLSNSTLVFNSKTQKISNNPCSFPLSVYFDESGYPLGNTSIVFDRINISSFILIPPNKASVSFNFSEALIKSKNPNSLVLFWGDIKIEKYIFGNIYFTNSNKTKNIPSCLMLPVESPNLLYSSYDS